MERRISEAAVEGSVESLLNLLQEDALILDRFIVSCYSDTPLHIASMLGHVDFVQEILSRKPELARALDSGNSSPLHLATAKGYLDIVKLLIVVNPEMCFVCDRDGKNPLHVAAIKGHINVLRELVHVRPQAARTLMERSESILHACVYYNKLEAMKFLVETMNDSEFVNSKDDDGNTILHLAVIDKQVQAVRFLTTSTRIDVNAINANGFSALDISEQRKFDVNDWKIGELLRCAGAISGKDIQQLAHEPGITHTGSMLTSHEINQGKRPEKVRKIKQADNWLEKRRNALMVVASLIAAMAFQAGVNPPGGVWQDDGNHKNESAGYSIMKSNSSPAYDVFFISNTSGFVASLSIILLLISGLPCFKHKFFVFILTVIMWVAISAMTLAYLVAVTSLSRPDDNGRLTLLYDDTASSVLLGWCGLVAILLLGHIIRVIVRMIKYIIRVIVKMIKYIIRVIVRMIKYIIRVIVKMIKYFVKLVKRHREPPSSVAYNV